MGTTLEERLLEDLRSAIKTKDTIRTSTLRMVKASMERFAIEKQIKNLEDRDIIRLIAKQIKQHEDSIESFQKGNRLDLVEKEKQELEILKSYMPQEISQDELIKIAQDKIKALGANSASDFGRVMKAVMEELKERADGKRVSQIVNEQLSGRPFEEKK